MPILLPRDHPGDRRPDRLENQRARRSSARLQNKKRDRQLFYSSLSLFYIYLLPFQANWPCQIYSLLKELVSTAGFMLDFPDPDWGF